MLKLTHFANSFISVESKNSTIVCDPWIGKTSDNGWFSYPYKNSNRIDDKIFNSDFIYISHLHCDHFDIKTLKKFKNKDLTFLIKKFKNGVLKKRIKKFTNKKIIEIEPFKKTIINKDFTVAIIPQIISNTSNLPDNIGYDLDTSIVIQSNTNKTIFYNNVDMPINFKILKQINKFVKKEFKGQIDIFCKGLGAASEYPQCFLNIDRTEEKKKIINKSLSEIKAFLNYLKPKIFFPAGGTYAIYGKFSSLNKFIAQPTPLQIKNKLNLMNIKTANIIGGGSIICSKSKYIINQQIDEMDKDFSENFINRIKKFNYYYKNTQKIDLKKLDKLFFDAKLNYLKILNFKKNIKSKWNIKFKIYKNYELNKNSLINKKKSKYLKSYNLKNYNLKSKNIFKLTCHLEYQLFQSLLRGKLPWNTSLSGSTIMYERVPNKFNVDMVFSLNFLRV
jgi:hypothetical protein